MNFLLVLLIVNFIFKCIKGDCTYYLESFDLAYSPIFLQKVGSELLVLPVTAGSLKFGDLKEIIAVCPSGFNNLQFKSDIKATNYDDLDDILDIGFIPELTPYAAYEFLPYVEDLNTMILYCTNGEIKISHENSLKEFKNLNCLSSAKSEIYEISSKQNCDKNYYTIGLNIQEIPIIFANICFDLDNMQLNFIHYVATPMTPVLSHINRNFNLTIKAEAPAESFFIDEYSAQYLIENLIGNQIDFVTFKYEELYTSDNLSPYISTTLESASRLNRFLGWTPFTQGNWKSFKNLLKSRSQKYTYDVYLGTSDVIVAPINDEYKSMKKLELEEFGTKVSVPKYVWAYLKSNNNKTDEFVVIGVNSPYFEFFPRNETIFCNDICDTIDWFAPIKMFRKISTFGYLFCCKKEEVEKRLHGFPVFDVNTITLNSTT